MLKYLVDRLLDTSKNTYYFLFILTKKVVLHRSPKTLLSKNNIVLSASSCRGMIWHAAACLENPVFVQPWHAAAWMGHAVACQPRVFDWKASCCDMAKPCRGMLSWLAQFCFLWLLFALICSFFDHSTRTSPTRWKHTLKCPKQVINNTKH